MKFGAILNAYPDSLGGKLSETVRFLLRPELKDAFRAFYILPTVFHTDLDRGFSVISYALNHELADESDLQSLRAMGLDLVCDLILNHLSVQSPQFQDLLRHGEDSEYKDFFIDWNAFWAGCGDMTDQGYIQPTEQFFLSANLRKKGLPLLMVRFPDGHEVPYWNTFYQKICYHPLSARQLQNGLGMKSEEAAELADMIRVQLDAGRTPATMDWGAYVSRACACRALLEQGRTYLGQMDVNQRSPKVWAWYDAVMRQLAGYGMCMIRLDAFTRLHKAPGRANFMNEPETWQILQRLKHQAAALGLDVLPEVHGTYASGGFRKISEQGCLTYDYFLPGLLLDALDCGDEGYLVSWAREQLTERIQTVNMLGCHDGIPIRDLRGLLPDARMEQICRRLETRGCRRKMIHGEHPEVYQMDGTYYSALGCDDRKMCMARALQIFMPGRPQVWYGDLLAAENDLSVFEQDPAVDAREMNRQCFTYDEAVSRLTRPVVREQLGLLTLRNTHPAFSESAGIDVCAPGPGRIEIQWQSGKDWAQLSADLHAMQYRIRTSETRDPDDGIMIKT